VTETLYLLAAGAEIRWPRRSSGADRCRRKALL